MEGVATSEAWQRILNDVDAQPASKFRLQKTSCLPDKIRRRGGEGAMMAACHYFRNELNKEISC